MFGDTCMVLVILEALKDYKEGEIFAFVLATLMI